jgi:hypothetical protein
MRKAVTGAGNQCLDLLKRRRVELCAPTTPPEFVALRARGFWG